jgi:hypothetical protein
VLQTIVVVLIVMWLRGMVTSYTPTVAAVYDRREKRKE